jgi:hypothetical protein
MQNLNVKNLKIKLKRHKDSLVSENYIKVPLSEPNIDHNLQPIHRDTLDFDLVAVPLEHSDVKRPLPLIKLTKKEFVINRDVLLFKKEQNLKVAIKFEKSGEIEKAMEYFEKASIISEKLGLTEESLSYFNRYQTLEKFMEEKLGTKVGEHTVINFFKRRILNIKESEFIKDMKDRVKDIKRNMSSSKSGSDTKAACEDLPGNVICYVDQGSIKKQKVSREYTPKNVSIPLINRKKYDEHLEYRRMLDDL